MAAKLRLHKTYIDDLYKMIEEELKVKRKEFLDDTVKYYSEDITRRATSDNGCKYRTKDGRKCAIGRHIPDKDYSPKIEEHNVGNTIVFDLLSNEIKILDKNFLTDIQSLHDFSDNWIESGLSQDGLYKYEEIKIQYSL